MHINMNDIKEFLNSPVFAVVGASAKRDKFGNKVLRCYIQNNLAVIPVNPAEKTIEGLNCLNEVSLLPAEVKSISIVTPPAVTTLVVKKAIEHGIKNIWIQPGAESLEAIKMCKDNGINIIANGVCVLVILGFTDE